MPAKSRCMVFLQRQSFQTTHKNDVKGSMSAILCREPSTPAPSHCRQHLQAIYGLASDVSTDDRGGNPFAILAALCACRAAGTDSCTTSQRSRREAEMVPKVLEVQMKSI